MMIGFQRLRLRACLLLGLIPLEVLSAGCDGFGGAANQPLTQIATEQLQQLPTFLADFARQALAAWLF